MRRWDNPPLSLAQLFLNIVSKGFVVGSGALGVEPVEDPGLGVK